MSLGLNLAKSLRVYRAKENRTQAWLAEHLEMARATINRWEQKGAGSATLDEVEMISMKLKIPPVELLDLGNREELDKLRARIEDQVDELLAMNSAREEAERELDKLKREASEYPGYDSGERRTLELSGIPGLDDLIENLKKLDQGKAAKRIKIFRELLESDLPQKSVEPIELPGKSRKKDPG